ncbi:MAG: hypothetical protein IRD7MM_03515 [Candidatus Midichloria mitochondrii]|uniref:hypothetical protein n=1 Tax=Candidatus Midichloria mitochondrii TaxID=234827 RepID=UPI0002E2FA66|nr:hypothetical protein [Candidatus Midichloria mitochondrii]MDJ1256501.1 hypothetical protein [Candidatus Midichloria mitochondrii]MDJ1288216.1 hypothetical protein [Candidatus Midichloria mitochondrii]MDJ1299030.1 hypothetical protein [Candidatus Midichloria mitochondrii]MDJ1313241.1 hypothetical protein [Candidatus Midichloria mitochondrii]MDJ1583782.1 hypothetical protein [Candidatus Midichloria mitochondrii]
MVTGDVDERSLVTLARDLKDKIEGVKGVLEVNIGEKKMQSKLSLSRQHLRDMELRLI